MKSVIFSLVVFVMSHTALAQFPWLEMEDQRLYIPQNIQQPAPVMVMLHGCLQTGETFAVSTQMNQVAEQNGFVVIYPDQSRVNNPLKCWNWFEPANHQRTANNEMQVILDLIGLAAEQVPLDLQRVYVAGLSAGGGMAANLMGCYSDFFAAGAVHSGLAFAAATSVGEAQSVMRNPQRLNPQTLAEKAINCVGEKGRTIPVFAVHGLNDTIVAMGHSQVLIQQFAIYNDFFDDRQINGSVSDEVFATRDIKDAPKQATLISYNRGQYPFLSSLIVDRMDHAWSGGKAGEQYSDPEGPNASRLIWMFVSPHKRQNSFF